MTTEANRGEPVDEATRGDAASWVVRMSSEEVAADDWLAFTAWLDASPGETPHLRREAFDRAQRVWLEAGRASVSAPAPAASRPVSASMRRVPRWLAWSALATAAALLISIFSARPHLASPPPADARQAAVYATRTGEHRLIRLPDGTRIALDGATTLDALPLGSTSRQVALVRGEASFDVVHDPRRPFTVLIGQARVRVIGTAFDISRAEGSTRVSVSRGLVRVETPKAAVELPAGRAANLTAGGLEVRSVDPSQTDAWREGRRIYQSAPLAAVVADLNRSYTEPLRLDRSAAAIRFTGVLTLGPEPEVVRRLTALLPLRAEMGADGAVVLSSRSR